MGGVLSFLTPVHPKPQGPHSVGCLRARLPSVSEGQHGLLAQVHYPADLDAPICQANSFPWFRSEVIEEIARGYGLPRSVMMSALGKAAQLDPTRMPAKADGKGWPVLVFTSGMYGCCEMYTQFCRELASQGLIVVALEHEDGSSVYSVSGNTGEAIPYENAPEGADMVAFNQPSLEQRSQDFRATASALQAAAKGSCTGMTVGHPEQDVLASVLRTADPDQLLIAGHSFGGASIVRYLHRLRENQEACPYRGALLMDLWGAPLLARDTAQGLQIPFAVLLSEMWLGTGAAISQRLMAASHETYLGGAAVQGTSHQWISESTYFGPSWLLRKINILGPGQLQRTHKATIAAAQKMVHALLDVSVKAQLQDMLVTCETELTMILTVLTCMEDQPPVSDEVKTYDCHVSKGWVPGCAFRANPFTGLGGAGMPHVKNGELLKGKVYEKDSMQFLKVDEVCRRGESEFKPVKGEQWMPFDAGECNGGKWLHEVPRVRV